MVKNILIQLIIALCILLNGFRELHAQVYPVSDPLNSGAWIFNEKLSDEFDGTQLDKTKWWILGENGDYRSKWKGRAPGQFAAHNVRIENGNLILSSKWEPNYNFAPEKNDGVYYGGTSASADKSKPITQACIMSETFFRYGYMEIKCKAADAPVTSSFWTTGYHSEIDMTENFGKRPIGNPNNKPEDLERKYRTNMISWDPDKDQNYNPWKVEDVLDVRVASDYFVYGFEWDRDYIKTYFNGKLIRYTTRQQLELNDQWRHQYPQELWLDTEVFYWYGLPSLADLETPAEYKIDYVRIWQKEITGPKFNALGFEGPFYFLGRSVNWWAPASAPWRMKNEKAASGEFSLRFKHSGALSGSHSIYAPFGSSDLPAGDNVLNFKIWIDPSTEISKLDFVLNNPWMKTTVELSGVEKGKWVELSANFNRNASSVVNLNSGDRLQITVNSADISSTEKLFYIDDISFKNSNLTGLNIQKKNDFQIYPNPANDVLTVKSKSSGTIKISNSAGIIIKSLEKKSYSEQINICELNSGIYFVSFFTGSKLVTQKVIIQ
jgi:beta-glucanase (GH16 family)